MAADERNVSRDPAGPEIQQATGTATVDVSFYDAAYRNGISAGWDVGQPQPAFARLVDSGVISGKVLDIGCGTGSDSLYYASRGLDVTGLDGSEFAISRARERARERGLDARFIVGDALTLSDLDETFDTVVECGLLHCFSDENMAKLVSEVHAVLRPSGHYVIGCMSDQATVEGPRRLSREELEGLFADGWKIESMEHFTLLVAPHIAEQYEAEGRRAVAWLVVLERQ